MYRYSLDMESFLRSLEKLPEQRNRQVSDRRISETCFLLRYFRAKKLGFLRRILENSLSSKGRTTKL